MNFFNSAMLATLPFCYSPQANLVDAFLDAPDARVVVSHAISSIYEDAGELISDEDLVEFVDRLPMEISRASLERLLKGISNDFADIAVFLFKDAEFLELLQARADLMDAYLTIVSTHVRERLAEKNDCEYSE
jgi:hypothetical protein